MVDGKKTPVIITVDKDMIILSEREDGASNQGIIMGDRFDEEGNKIGLAIQPGESEVLRFFTPGYKCTTAGCQKLHDEYQRKVDTAKAANCKNCELGALIREYAPRVREILK